MNCIKSLHWWGQTLPQYPVCLRPGWEEWNWWVGAWASPSTPTLKRSAGVETIHPSTAPGPSELSATCFSIEAEVFIPCEEHPAMSDKMGFHHPTLSSSRGACSFRYHRPVWDLVSHYGHLCCVLAQLRCLQLLHQIKKEKKGTLFTITKVTSCWIYTLKIETSGAVKFLLYVRMACLLFLSQINKINPWLPLLCSMFLSMS